MNKLDGNKAILVAGLISIGTLAAKAFKLNIGEQDISNIATAVVTGVAVLAVYLDNRKKKK